MEPVDVYSRLDPARREIRLLRLLPGSWEDPISCDLQVVSLDDQPSYQGLSYAWGKSGIPKTIQLHGKPFGVTVNLWAALRRLRRPRHERILWADATCINQADIQERSTQVAIMGEIYSSATEVFIWLGDSISENDSLQFSPGIIEDGKDVTWFRENIEQSLECSSFLNHENEASAAFGILHLLSHDEHWTTKPVFVADNEGRYYVAENHAAAWQATMKLLQLRWWSRIWVVQELVLPKTATLVVGCVSAPWQLISEFCNSYLKHLPPGACCHSSATWKMTSELWDDIVRIRLTFLSFYEFRNEIAKPPSKSPSSALWQYLWFLRHKEATDPRDKVYGLLGLLYRYQHTFLVPDYSMSTAETFSMCMEALIKSDVSLSALIGPRLRKSGLPTWAIDFLPEESSESIFFFHNLFRRISSSVIFNACGNQQLHLSRQLSKIILRGVAFDRVKEIATVWPAWEEGVVARTFRDWEKLSCTAGNDTDSVYPSGCTRTDAFWRTLIRDTIRDYQNGEKVRRANHTDEASYTHFRRWVTDPSDSNNAAAVADPGFANFRKSFFIATQHQHLFTTCKGYIGLSDVPQANDEIWILSGGSVPFILRPYPDDSDQAGCYSLVGDCYVHGIMDGEATKASGKAEAKEDGPSCLVGAKSLEPDQDFRLLVHKLAVSMGIQAVDENEVETNRMTTRPAASRPMEVNTKVDESSYHEVDESAYHNVGRVAYDEVDQTS